MKKRWIAATSVALVGCMLFAFTGCGAVNKAKSMKGEEVNAEGWSSAMTQTALFGSDAADAGMETVAEQTTASNFKVDLEVKSEGTVAFGTEKMNVDLNFSGSLVVAESGVAVTVKYDYNVELPDSLKDMELDEKLKDKGELELYIVRENGAMVYVFKNANDEWIKSKDAYGANEIRSSVVETVVELVDQSAVAAAFADFTYSAEDKGYVPVDVDAGLSGSSGGIAASARLVYKIKEGKLGAIYASGEADISGEEGGIGTKVEVGIVYTYGGQSVSVPAVAG